MKKLMDIISNWNKGKKAHDERVAAEGSGDLYTDLLKASAKGAYIISPNRTPDRIKDILRIAEYIEEEIRKSAPNRSFEAKLWQILAEYAQDQVKALTEPKRETAETCAPYSKVDPSLREKIETFPSKFAKGGYVGDMPNAIV